MLNSMRWRDRVSERTSEGNLGQVSPSHDDGVAHMATFLLDRRLETPAILALEILRPFSFLISQFLVMAQPMLSETLRRRSASYQSLLQDQGEIDRLVALLASRASAAARTEEDPCQPSPS